MVEVSLFKIIQQAAKSSDPSQEKIYISHLKNTYIPNSSKVHNKSVNKCF